LWPWDEPGLEGFSRNSLRRLFCKNDAILSCRYPLLQSVCLPHPARRARHLTSRRGGLFEDSRQETTLSATQTNNRAPLVGFSSLQRKQRKESASPGLTSPGTFRSRGFAPPQRFPPPCTSQAYFILERSWDFPFRAFFLRRSRTPFGASPLLLFSRAFIHGWQRQRYQARTR